MYPWTTGGVMDQVSTPHGVGVFPNLTATSDTLGSVATTFSITSTFHAVFHCLIWVADCGTNANNFQFNTATNVSGFSQRFGIWIDTNGIASGVRYGGNRYLTTYYPKASAQGRLLSIGSHVYESSSGVLTVTFYVNGQYVGTGDSAVSSWGTWTPTMEALLSNSSGAEPRGGILQAGLWLDCDQKVAQHLSADPYSVVDSVL